jgi:hypothetical protein
MQLRTDHGTIRLRLFAETPCVVRVAWYADGRLVGQRRLWHRETDLLLPEGRWTLEISDERSAHDPSRLAPTRLEVLVRAGWRTATDVVLTRGAVLTGFVADTAPRLARFATVGDCPTPISTNRSTPRPPFSTLANMRSCVSIQRTGLANCQASSSTSSVRHSAWGRAVHASTSARTASRGEGPTRSATSWMKSSASENGRGTRFGT